MSTAGLPGAHLVKAGLPLGAVGDLFPPPSLRWLRVLSRGRIPFLSACPSVTSLCLSFKDKH